LADRVKRSRGSYEFRYVATREVLQEQEVLPGTPPKEYPFPVAVLGENRYKIQSIVTNRAIPDLSIFAVMNHYIVAG
jgi:hypothetical protein